ncbi:MAG: rhomboid family intramembrane serine protease [Bacteroidota bacterium]
MFRSIWEDIKREFSYGNMVTRLVIINVMVFIVVNLVWVALQIANGYKTSSFYSEFLSFFAMSSYWLDVLTHPWAIITSMFLHEGFFHILFNMLLLYWFGRIIGDLLGDHRVLPLYLLAGLAGNVVYFITANLILPYAPGSIAYGASGAVMGIVIAAAVLAPEMEMRLLLLGNIKLKYIAAGLLLIDIIGIGGMNNTGGHFAHLGGAAFGWFFIRRLQSGDDLSAPVNNFLNKIREFFRGLGQDRGEKKGRGPRVAYRNPNNKTQASPQQNRFGRRKSNRTKGKGSPELSHEERVDAILEKIKESGYENLTEEEKKFLFNASKK